MNRSKTLYKIAARRAALCRALLRHYVCDISVGADRKIVFLRQCLRKIESRKEYFIFGEVPLCDSW